MNVRVVYLDLPSAIKGTIVYDSVEDFYTIVINAKYNNVQQTETYKHELKHLLNDDFNSRLYASDAERGIV